MDQAHLENRAIDYCTKESLSWFKIEALLDEDNPKVRFKSCGRFLLKLEHIPGAKNNESRSVHDVRFAKFRSERMKCLKILDRCSGKFVQEIYHSWKSGWAFLPSELEPDWHPMHFFVYRVDAVVESGEYDEIAHHVSTTGLHYYLTLFAAYCHNIFFELENVNLRIQLRTSGLLLYNESHLVQKLGIRSASEYTKYLEPFASNQQS